MGVRVGEIMDVLESIAPLELAEEGDHVGLQVGDPDWEVKAVLVSLNADGEVLEEAKEAGAGLIVAHHPLIIFKGLDRVTSETEPGATIMEALRSEIAVYAAHTNADSASGGVSELLAEGLGIIQCRPIWPAQGKDKVKVVTFVPEEDVEAVRKALCDAGAGVIGNYRDCSFRTEGTGTFFGTEDAEPAVGTKGRLEEVDEWRLEVVVGKSKLAEVVRALLDAHPYETPAYDIYPLVSSSYQTGLGRIGILPKPIRAAELAERVKGYLGLERVRVAGEMETMVETVAVCGGGGGDPKDVEDVIRQGAEAYVTGDIKYHTARKAAAEGIVLIDAGHAATELPVVKWLARQLEQRIAGVRFLVSEAEVEPFEEV